MAKINLLDSSIFNLLSAGEVVERPASIVKELVENSIDAGATEISVNIYGGGIKSIAVIDNGVGIEPDELEKAALPHATSKIKEAPDLQSIATLGFRGEALPSIAAVSVLEIKSKYIDAEHAKMIKIKGGQILASLSTSLAKGTSVKVGNLFFNTPARLKFLKSPGAEQAAITHTLKNLALSHPFIAFRYLQEDKEVFSTYGNGLEETANIIYGKEIVGNLIKIDIEDRGIFIQGYISSPKIFKNNKRQQTLIINSRVLSAPEVQGAIHNAYAHRLMTRCFPIYVLDIVMPFDNLDVNVHPQKATVRFANARTICSVVYYAVKNALEEYEKAQVAPLTSASNFEVDATQFIKEQVAADNDNAESVILDQSSSLQDRLLKAYKYTPKESNNSAFAQERAVGIVSAKSSDPLLAAKFKEKTAPIQDAMHSLPQDATYKIIGQAFDTYIIVEMGQELIFIDQHAAHERIIFDRMLSDFAQGSPSQLLLTPYIYSCPYDDISYLIDFLPNLTRVGFEIEEFGGNHFKISAIPNNIVGLELTAFLDSILKDKYSDSNELLEEYIAKKSCKAAIKGGDSLNKEEIAYVMDYFIAHSLPMHCPHGRPTLIKFKRKELEGLFGRIK